MDKLQELAVLVFITPLYVMAAVKVFQFVKKKLRKFIFEF